MNVEVWVSLFDDLLAQATVGSRLDHRAHVHVTWLAVREAGMPAAVSLVSEGIQRTARYAGAPQKYHATLSRAWVELVAHHAQARPAPDFAHFARDNPELLDKRLVTRFYSSTTLAGQAARTGWVEPDVAPFPWLARGSDARSTGPQEPA
jgi:hypothetical protein